MSIRARSGTNAKGIPRVPPPGFSPDTILCDGNPEEISDDTAAPGTSEDVSRCDHVHPHGARGGGTLHADAVPVDDPTAAGFMSGADKIALDSLASGKVPVVTRTGNTYNVVVANDGGAHVLLNNGSAMSVVLPTSSEIGTTIDFEWWGVGQPTISGDVGVTVRRPSIFTGAIRELYAVVTARLVAVDVWTTFGDYTLAP